MASRNEEGKAVSEAQQIIPEPKRKDVGKSIRWWSIAIVAVFLLFLVRKSGDWTKLTEPTAKASESFTPDSLTFTLNCGKKVLILPDTVKIKKIMFNVSACNQNDPTAANGPTQWVEIPDPDKYFQMNAVDIRGPLYNTYDTEVMYDDDRAQIEHVQPNVPLPFAGGAKGRRATQSGTVNVPNKFRFIIPNVSEETKKETDGKEKPNNSTKEGLKISVDLS